MLLSFNPFVLLLWISLICFLPGALISFSLLRKSRLLVVEKLLLGFGLGIVLLPLIPFLLYMIAGIKYSYSIALISVAVLYAAAIALVVKNRTYEDIRLPEGISLDKNVYVSLILVFVVLITLWIRLSPYSPIFFELDPYYYTYAATQLLTFGENPFNDQTAWYPDAVVSHRVIPELSYLEALWYSFYSGGAQYNELLLSVIASVYPPIAAALAVFFLYLFVSSFYRREWGLLAAGLASFVPIFLFKTTSGVMEVQPYAFFALAFFLSMYALMLKEKNILFAVLAGIAYCAVVLGSMSEILVLSAILAFVILKSIFLYLREEDNSRIRTFLIHNAVVFVIGSIFGSGILKGLFYDGKLLLIYPAFFFSALAFGGILYLLRERLADAKLRRTVLLGILLIGIFSYFFTPVGTIAKSFIASSVSVAQYNFPLDRTIAEQHPAGKDLSGQFGFVSASYPGGVDALMSIASLIVNAILAVTIGLLNWIVGTNIQFVEKSNNMLLLWIGLFGIAIVYSFYRLIRKEDTPVFLFAAVIFPPLLIGIIKAKYTIYAGFLLAAGIAFIFGEAEILGKRLGKYAEETKVEEYKKYTYYGLAILASLLLLLQLYASSRGFIPAVLSQSFKTRFQDDPSAFSAKFQSICTSLAAKGVTEQSLCSQYSSGGFSFCTTYDTDICTVAADPVSYASKGTNEQYNSKLCYYSLISDVLSPKTEELIAADFRCKRLDTYWVETMEWMKDNTPEGSRFTSWWDYGHWTNYFGQRDTVLRNEHVSKFMIGEVAYAYLDGTPGELADFMRSRNSSYAIFDKELSGTVPYLGGKYGALNYLMCARNNQTSVATETGLSVCEAEHLWETILVPSNKTSTACTISKAGKKTGILAYKAYWTWNQSEPFRYTAIYPNTFYSGVSCYGSYLNNPTVLGFCQNYVKVKPAYCLGEVLLATGKKSVGVYLLNETSPSGDLKLNKAELFSITSYPQTLHLGDVIVANLFYSKYPMFLENGNITSGYEDRRTKFYSSNLYRALFLDELPGFTKVFESKDKMVKIYKLKD